METLSDETRSVLELLASIRRTQSKTLDSMSNGSYWLLRFETDIDTLAQATSKLSSAVPPEPTEPQTTGFRRDVQEFKAGVADLKGHFAELCAITTSVKDDMADIKATLDIIQTRFENCDA